MPAALNTAPTAAPIIVVAIAVLAIAATVAVLVILHRSRRLSGLAVGVSAAVAVAILAGAVLVGGSLAPEPVAAASFDRPVSQVPVKPVGDPALVGVQLPTLDAP